MAELTDEEIALRVQHGQVQWFAFLVERYEKKMIRYAQKFLFGNDVQDVVQEVFTKSFISIQSFNINQRFSPWLYRIAHNEFINVIKKKGREKTTYFDSDTLFPHPVYEEEVSKLDNEKMKKALDTCLDKIDIKYREPIVLFCYEEMDYQKIAEIMHIPVSTVGIRLKRGRSRLKKIFNELYPEHE